MIVMNELMQIDGREDVLRDTNSKALLKTDLREKEAWLIKKERDNKIVSNENGINKVKEEISEMKNTLNEILKIVRKSN